MVLELSIQPYMVAWWLIRPNPTAEATVRSDRDAKKLFCVTAKGMAWANDGGDYEVLYRRRQLNIAEWERLRM